MAIIIRQNEGIYFLLYFVCLHFNKNQKGCVNPPKISKFSFCTKSMLKSYLIVVMHCFYDYITLSGIFLHFARPIKICTFDSIFQLLKGMFCSQKKVALVVKNSIDSENGVKCCLKPSDHIFLEYPPKNMC